MSQSDSLPRRQLLKQLGLAAGALVLPIASNTCTAKKVITKTASLKFGVMADVHADLIPDKMERLEKFIDAASQRDVDFVVQLGDFCFPKQSNLDFLKLWNQFKNPKYHLLGNHDMDLSSKKETMNFWAMPEAYYSFDQKGIHFVVLDPNYLYADHKYIDYDNSNFYVDDSLRTFVNPEQLEWLVTDLQQTELPAIILSHQSLINPMWGIKNRVEIQKILEKENTRVGYSKVIACFNGHDHIDFHRTLNGIHYIEMNSMSYQWLGKKYSNKTRYPAEYYEEYAHLDKIGPYKDSLFAFAEVDVENGELRVGGVESEWLGPSPSEMGMPKQDYGMEYSARISDRIIDFN